MNLKKIKYIIFLIVLITNLYGSTDYIQNNNRTLFEYSAQTLGAKNVQYCPLHILSIYDYKKENSWDGNNHYIVSGLLDFNIGVFNILDVTLAPYKIGLKINLFHSRKILYTSGISFFKLINGVPRIIIPQYFQIILSKKSKMNINFIPSLTKSFDYYTGHIYLDYERYFAKKLQYIIFGGAIELEDNIQPKYYFGGVGLR